MYYLSSARNVNIHKNYSILFVHSEYIKTNKKRWMEIYPRDISTSPDFSLKPSSFSGIHLLLSWFPMPRLSSSRWKGISPARTMTTIITATTTDKSWKKTKNFFPKRKNENEERRRRKKGEKKMRKIMRKSHSKINKWYTVNLCVYDELLQGMSFMEGKIKSKLKKFNVLKWSFQR